MPMISYKIVKCFMGLFDILGYKDIVAKEDIEEIFRVHNYLLTETQDSFSHIDGVYKIGRDPGFHDKRMTMHSYSDTILFYSTDISDKPKGEVEMVFLETLVAVDFLFMAANKSKLTLRGAITTGNLIDYNNIVVSKEIVEAYEMEKRQNWVGCWINDRCFEKISKEAIQKHISSNSIIEYDIPMKCGTYERGYAYNWAKNYLIEDCPFLKEMTANLHRDDVRVKYGNTLKFIQYVKKSII